MKPSFAMSKVTHVTQVLLNIEQDNIPVLTLASMIGFNKERRMFSSGQYIITKCQPTLTSAVGL